MGSENARSGHVVELFKPSNLKRTPNFADLPNGTTMYFDQVIDEVAV